jgi:uncharacterized repeat protein (TIGR03803 family)
MTTPGSGERFTFVPSRSRASGSMGKASWKMLCALFVLCATIASAQTFRTVVAFPTNGVEGYYPEDSLVQGLDGDFYGTTLVGGTHGQGNVFKVTSGGTVTTLYSFCAETNCTDGSLPSAGLVLATDGNFYGTTSRGGAINSCPFSSGCGTVFKITPEGKLTTLYVFCSQN